MAIAAGSRVAGYEVLSLIGAGGMGEVYRARDTRLNRDVALKILPETFALDADRLARFRREAQVLASLNHPNIGAMYGFEESNGTHALVLELVEGSTLADRIAQGPIPLDEALPIAKQVAEALEGAHEQGIVHRDLKPANIKVRDDGTVKVLDFGLAKAFAPDPSAASGTALSNSPTITGPAAVTGIGVLLGTAAYMSPEQAKGKATDKRSDVWSFACVLYEMLAGRRAFEGEDVSDNIAAVLRGEPEWSALPRDTPAPVVQLLRRSLEKDARHRLRGMAAVLFVLNEPEQLTAKSNTLSVGRPSIKWTLATAAIAATVAAVVTGGISWFWMPAAPNPLLTRLSFVLPPDHRFANTGRQAIEISPDGKHIAYTANRSLWIRPMSGGEPRPLVSEGQFALIGPAFSPDGQHIAFWSGLNVGAGSSSALRRVPIAGGAPSEICPVAAVPHGITWVGHDIYFALAAADGNPSAIFRVSADGGEPVQVVKAAPGEALYGPRPLPGNRGLLFNVAEGLSSARWDNARIVAQLPSGEQKTILKGGSDGRYLPTGHLLYATRGILYAVRFDVERLEASGPRVAVLEGVARTSGAASGATQFGVADTGTVILIPGAASTGRGRILALFSRTGDATPIDVPIDTYEFPRVSPDGTRIAVGTNDGQSANISIYDLGGGSSLGRLTDGGKNRFPIWSRDGRHVAFQSDREGDLGIWWQAADGSAQPKRLTRAEAGTAHVPDAWSPQSDTLLFTVVRGTTQSLFALSVPDGKSTSVANITSSNPITPVFAPGGRWFAYHTSVQGRYTVWVQPFPPEGTAREVSAEGTSHHPVWLNDGSELLYVTGAAAFSARRISLVPGFSLGRAQSFRDSIVPTAPPMAESRNFDVLPDGRIVADADSLQLQPGLTQRIDVVQNWFQELERLVPTN